jgi:CIC family chloride channel protein
VPAWRLRESQLFLVLTIVIGILAGLSVVLFALGIDAAQHFFFGTSPSTLRLILVPTLVSLVSGVLLHKYFTDVRGSGVPQTKAAYHLRQGVIPARVPIGKFITGVLCIGSGHSMGREGPSVQIGAGLASAIGQWLRLPEKRTKSLVPVGASAALAAAFNTPVAAVLFALEEIIADLNATLLGSTVIASIAAVVVARSILGNLRRARRGLRPRLARLHQGAPPGSGVLHGPARVDADVAAGDGRAGDRRAAGLLPRGGRRRLRER